MWATLLIFLFFPSSFWGLVPIYFELKNPVVHAVVGEKVNLSLVLSSSSLERDQMVESMMTTALSHNIFFEDQGGDAKLIALTYNQKGMTVTFVPKRSGKGICFFPPLYLKDKAFFWPAFQFSFEVPQLPSFNEPLLQKAWKPLLPSASSLVTSSLSRFFENKTSQFQERETRQFLLWNVSFLFEAAVGCYFFFRKRWIVWKEEYRKKKREQVFVRKLRQAVKKKEEAWNLLLLRLLIFLERQYGETRQMSARQLAFFFVQKGQQELSEVARLIDQYAYRPYADFQKFQEACHLCDRGIDALILNEKNKGTK